MRRSTIGTTLGFVPAILFVSLLVPSCLGDGGDGRKGLDHELKLSAIAPEEGPSAGGTDVLITGFNFQQDGPITDVLFGTEPAASFDIPSNNQIFAITPANPPGRVDVVVRNLDGDEARLTGAFEFTSPPGGTPTCLTIFPSSGSGGDTVTITTSGFTDDFMVCLPMVFFGTSPATSVTPLTSTALVCDAPPGAASQSVDVTVQARCVSESCVFLDGFTYVPVPPPPCMAVIPDRGDLGGGTSVDISALGPCFWDVPPSPPPIVLFGGVPAMNVTVISQTLLDCTTPPGVSPGPVDVEVITSTCTCLLPSGFTYTGGCTIMSIVPEQGGTNGGLIATISGLGFNPPCVSVLFGGIYVHPNQIVVDPVSGNLTCVTPPSRVGGFVDVEVRTCTGASCVLPSGFEYILPGTAACAIGSISPAQGPVSGNTTVTIDGTGFDPNSGVLFGNRPASQVTVLGPGQIVAVTPAADAPGSVDVTVAPENSDPCTVGNGYVYN